MMPLVAEPELRLVPIYVPAPRIDLSPEVRARVDALVRRLLDDESWAGGMTDDERLAWQSAAYISLCVAAREGQDLDMAYRRVLAMLKAGHEPVDAAAGNHGRTD